MAGLRAPDPGHGWEAGRAQLRRASSPTAAATTSSRSRTTTRARSSSSTPRPAEYTVYDRFFCSLLASTWPNRYYKWSAQSGGRKDNTPPLETAGNQWETIFDRAIGRGVSARYYNSDLPFSAVWGARGASWTRPLAEYYADCALGTLPNISFVDPPFRDGGGGDGISADEHPHGDVRLGQAWMADVVSAFVKSRELPPRRAVRRLRRVGRLLRPRHAAARARRARQRATSTRTSARWASASPPSPSRRHAGAAAGETRVRHATARLRVDPQADPYRFGPRPLTDRDRYATNIGRTFDWSRPRLRGARPARPRARGLAAVRARRRRRADPGERAGARRATSPRSRTWPTARRPGRRRQGETCSASRTRSGAVGP